LAQALTVSHNRALPHWYRHSQYHTTDYHHIGTSTDSIAQQGTDTLVEALAVSKTEHCHIGRGTDSITQQTTATLVQALTVSHSRALPHW